MTLWPGTDLEFLSCSQHEPLHCTMGLASFLLSDRSHRVAQPAPYHYHDTWYVWLRFWGTLSLQPMAGPELTYGLGLMTYLFLQPPRCWDSKCELHTWLNSEKTLPNSKAVKISLPYFIELRKVTCTAGSQLLEQESNQPIFLPCISIVRMFSIAQDNVQFLWCTLGLPFTTWGWEVTIP